jgi:hypothetical protein
MSRMRIGGAAGNSSDSAAVESECRIATSAAVQAMSGRCERLGIIGR